MENFYNNLKRKELVKDTYLNRPPPKLNEEIEKRLKVKTKDIFIVKNKKLKSPKYKKPKFKLGSRIKKIFKNENMNY